MPIRFSCPSCFKVHSAPDHMAGLPGRCGRCGYGFKTPGVPVSTPPGVFAPAAAPDPFASGGLNPPARGGTGWGGAVQAVTLGLILAVLSVGFLWQFRDQLVAAHPGLEPLLPPKVVKAAPGPVVVAPVGPAQAPVVQVPANAPLVNQPVSPDDPGGWTFAGFVVSYDRLVGALLGLGFLVVLPLLLPPILSRRGYLSMGRWVIFAGACFLAASLAGAVYEAEVQRIFAFPSTTKDLSSLICLVSTMGTFGCLIAGGISPKTPAS